jgi:D-serine deaminase-like pyridoxal phosphate-dependent protein
VWLDVDVGMGRTGTAAARWRQALAERDPRAAGALEIRGIHGYEGHLAWGEREPAHAGYSALIALAQACASTRCIVTSGTHAFAHALAFAPLRAGPWRHQVSPGTVVLSDLRSGDAAELLGLRTAAFVASRVVSVRDDAGGERRITVDAGSKALAPDRPEPAGALLGWPAWLAVRATEEHRVLQPSAPDVPAPARDTVVFIAPSHVCTTVNLYREVVHVRGDRLVGLAPIEAGRHTTLAPRVPPSAVATRAPQAPKPQELAP